LQRRKYLDDKMELRKDYLLDRWVIISSSRGKRPHELIRNTAQTSEGVCFFCPGNENLTPNEIFRLPDGKGGWKVRVIPNKFAATDKSGKYKIETHNTYYTFSDAFGDHEIVVETPDHKKQLADLSIKEIKDILDVYASRIMELSSVDGVKYVQVFKNSGYEGGTSLVHSHTQIISYNIIPTRVNEKVLAAKRFVSCPYCSIVDAEKKSDRRCFENNSFAAFTPYASRFNYEIWIVPKFHVTNITNLSNDQMLDLSEILQKVLGKIGDVNFSYNFAMTYSPEGENLHFHIEVAPRIAIWAGFELGTDTIINSVSPEDAAKWYRGELQ